MQFKKVHLPHDTIIVWMSVGLARIPHTTQRPFANYRVSEMTLGLDLWSLKMQCEGLSALHPAEVFWSDMCGEKAASTHLSRRLVSAKCGRSLPLPISGATMRAVYMFVY